MIWIAALLLLTIAGCTYIKQSGTGNTVEVREASIYTEAEVDAEVDAEEQEIVEIDK